MHIDFAAIFGFTPQQARELLARLSQREREVAMLIAADLGRKAIARRLAIAEGTCAIHSSRVRQKLDDAGPATVAKLLLLDELAKRLD